MERPLSTSKVKRTLTVCRICTSPALYSYVGVIVCASCKMFFKRNAQMKQFRCHYNGLCEINGKNRHLCGYCRMKKCLDNGMQVELLRNGRSTRNKIQKSVKKEKQNCNDSQQLSTLSLLRTDQSTLTGKQWNLLSNLVHWYDEHSQFALVEHFLRDQNQLPLKMRFKVASVHEVLIRIMSGSEHLYGKNADFLSLCSLDRSILLHKTIKQIVGLTASFITYRSKLMDNPAFYQMSEIIYGEKTLENSARIMSYLDSDPVFFKLVLGILMFSTFSCTDYPSEVPYILQDIKSILNIQDMYVELIWRYLLYRYNHQQAVRCFSNLIRGLFALYQALTNAMEVPHYNDTIDSLVNQTEKSLCVDS